MYITEHHLKRKPVPLFHACSRAEARPLLVALFTVVKEVAKQLGYPSTRIRCCGMDHCKASLNGLLDVEPSATAVDCNIHVLRGMAKNKHRLVNKLYLDTAIGHAKVTGYVYTVCIIFNNIKRLRCTDATCHIRKENIYTNA